MCHCQQKHCPLLEGCHLSGAHHLVPPPLRPPPPTQAPPPLPLPSQKYLVDFADRLLFQGSHLDTNCSNARGDTPLVRLNLLLPTCPLTTACNQKSSCPPSTYSTYTYKHTSTPTWVVYSYASINIIHSVPVVVTNAVHMLNMCSTHSAHVVHEQYT